MTAAGPGPDPGDRKDSIADEGFALADQTSDPTPGPSARTGLSTSQAGPVGSYRSGRALLEAGSTQSEMANADFLGCFGVANALEPPKPLRSSYTSLALRPELPVFLPQTSNARNPMDSLSDASSYDADSDESSDHNHDHEPAAEDFYEVADDFIEDFIRDLSVEEEKGLRSPITSDYVSRAEFESMKLEYWGRFVEQSEETQQSIEKANALSAELLVYQSELQAATERFSRIASALQCSICLDTFSQPHSLACGHIFCKGCLLQWLETSLKCPACRAHVPMRPAPAYAVKEVLALVSPQTDGESSSAPASRGDGETTDPWACLFPTRREPEVPGINSDFSRRMQAARAMRRQMAANVAGPENDTEHLHERYRNRLSMLMARLIELTESRVELRQGHSPASPSVGRQTPRRVMHEAQASTQTLPDLDTVNASIDLVTESLQRHAGAYYESLRRPFGSSTPDSSQDLDPSPFQSLVGSASVALSSTRRLPRDTVGTQLPLRLPPRLTRMAAGSSSGQASSPRIPIPPPRERPPTRPVRPATGAVPGPSPSPSIPAPSQSRLRQPTRIARQEGTAAASTTSSATTTTTTATTTTVVSGSSARTPIRISHIMNSSHNSYDHTAQTAAAGTDRHANRETRAAPGQVVAESSMRLTESNRRLLESNRRLNESHRRLADSERSLEESERRLAESSRSLTESVQHLLSTNQPVEDPSELEDALDAAIQALAQTRQPARGFGRFELLDPADSGNSYADSFEERLLAFRHRQTEMPRTSTRGAGEASATASRTIAWPRRPRRSEEETSYAASEVRRRLASLQEDMRASRHSDQGPAEPAQRHIRVSRPLPNVEGRQGPNARNSSTAVPNRPPRLAMPPLDSDIVD
ncbi:E3 ubiquitin ligase [Coemansia sp. RSA 2050]|nr:E3 ubiquitin ligase [Coemansia sp. RSA 2050]KAJ2729538.1 E3 ubiquitin ligase [Coemansia sp. BCRC 34962]